ncbi:MAG TPA: hypothetical protein GX707_09015 [Epulopiscium sp.]|nr:hypothetical protein [Candidatus Epulonipiscium sp.]
MTASDDDFKELDKILHTDAPDVQYIFNKLIDAPNYECIHPVKQRQVYALAQALLAEDEDDLITDIIVFGSTVTLFCDSFSDIDMAVLGNFDVFSTRIPLYEYGEVDLFGYNKEAFLKIAESNHFYSEIIHKGVRVYEQLSTPSKG